MQSRTLGRDRHAICCVFVCLVLSIRLGGPDSGVTDERRRACRLARHNAPPTIPGDKRRTAPLCENAPLRAASGSHEATRVTAQPNEGRAMPGQRRSADSGAGLDMNGLGQSGEVALLPKDQANVFVRSAAERWANAVSWGWELLFHDKLCQKTGDSLPGAIAPLSLPRQDTP